MSIILIPALISLLCKLFVLAYVLRGGKVSILFLSLIIVFGIHNAIEATGYIQHFSGNTENIAITFRLYYIATVYLLLYILLHAIKISKIEKVSITALMVLSASLICAAILFTDSIVAGHLIINYTMTAIKGPFYWVFSSFIIATLISIFACLTYGQRNARTELEATRCKYSLLALLPILIVLSAVIICKIMNLNVTAIGLLPIATTLFLVIILKTESKHKLSDIKRLLPMSLERKTASNFLSMLDIYVNNSNVDNVYKDLQYGIEREIVSYSLQRCNHNIADTAKLMGIRNRSTLYAMINRLDINIDALKQTECNNNKKKIRH